jgi:hypothetical protein
MPAVAATADIASRASTLLQRFEAAAHAAVTGRSPGVDLAGELIAVRDEAVALDHELQATRAPGAGDATAYLASAGNGSLRNLADQRLPEHRMDDWSHLSGYALWTGIARIQASAAAATPGERIDNLAALAHHGLERAASTLAEAPVPSWHTPRYDARLRHTAFHANEAADITRAVAALGTGTLSPASVHDALAAADQLGADGTYRAARFGSHTPRADLHRQAAVVTSLDGRMAADFAAARGATTP